MVVGTKWFAKFVRTRAAERAVWISALFILVNLILSNRSYNGLLGGSGTDEVSAYTPDSLTPGASTSQRQSSLSKEDPALSDVSNATSDTNQTLTLAPACEGTHMKMNLSDAGGLVDNCTAEIGRLQLVMDGLHREYGLESMRNGLVMAGGQVRYISSLKRPIFLMVQSVSKAHKYYIHTKMCAIWWERKSTRLKSCMCAMFLVRPPSFSTRIHDSS